MKPWLVVAIGLALAVAAGYALLTSDPIPHAKPEAAPHGDIRDDSRAKMRELLREEGGD